MPIALSHESREEAAILFSSSAIFDGEATILCQKAGGESEHSTDPVVPPVTSLNRRHIRRFTPDPGSMRELLLQNSDLPGLLCSRQQQPSGTSQLSLVEKEAIRWKGKPWFAVFVCSCCSCLKVNQSSILASVLLL